MSIFDAASFRRFVADVRKGPSDLIIPAEHLEAAAELMAGPQVTRADFDLDPLDDAPGMTWHPAYIATLCADFGRELDYRLADVLDEWTDRLPYEEN